MERTSFEKVMNAAAAERGLSVVELMWDDDENVFEITLDKAEGEVDIHDCEHVHRAILTAFDRNIEDYSLTVSSVGLSPEEADELLKDIDE